MLRPVRVEGLDVAHGSAIIEASRAMGCPEVLSEDLGDGQDYAGIRVINPFH
jgi:predicted nucleic acid-binding protein